MSTTVLLLFLSFFHRIDLTECYIIPSLSASIIKQTWFEAEQYCITEHDSHLLSIHSMQQYEDLLALLSTTKSTFWIGLHLDPNISSSFIWTDDSIFNFGSDLNDYPWNRYSLRSPSPSTSNKPICVRLSWNHSYSWQDTTDCDNKHYPICNDLHQSSTKRPFSTFPTTQAPTMMPTMEPTIHPTEVHTDSNIYNQTDSLQVTESEYSNTNEDILRSFHNDRILLYGFVFMAIIFGCVIFLCLTYLHLKLRITATKNEPQQRHHHHHHIVNNGVAADGDDELQLTVNAYFKPKQSLTVIPDIDDDDNKHIDDEGIDNKRKHYLYRPRRYVISKSPHSKTRSRSKTLTLPKLSSLGYSSNKRLNISPQSFQTSIQTSLYVRSPTTRSRINLSCTRTEDMALIVSECGTPSNNHELIVSDIDMDDDEEMNSYIDNKRELMRCNEEEEDEYLSPSDMMIKSNIFSIGMNLRKMQNMSDGGLILPAMKETDEEDEDDDGYTVHGNSEVEANNISW